MLLPFSLFSQISFSDIDGKWQEEKRLKKKKEIPFTDTLRLEIRKDGFMLIRHTIGPTYTGEAELAGKKLKLEKEKFEVVDYSRKSLSLKDDDGTHVFRKADEFSASPIQKVIPGREEGEKDIAIATLKGKWTAYKKTDPKFDKNKFYLKAIQFNEDKGGGTYKGIVTFNTMDSVYNTDAFIYVKGTDFIISSDNETFKAKVLKSDGEELLLEEGSVTYFLKQFGKKPE